MSFYGALFSSTCTLLAVVTAIAAYGYCRDRNLSSVVEKRTSRMRLRFFAVYLLVFAYPTVATKVVRVYGCHDVNSKWSIVRADPQTRLPLFSRTDPQTRLPLFSPLILTPCFLSCFSPVFLSQSHHAISASH
jgi:hypothetical protein